MTVQVVLKGEFVETLAKDDPLGDRKTYPAGWRGSVSEKLAAQMKREGVLEAAIRPEEPSDDEKAAKNALKVARGAVTKAEKAFEAAKTTSEEAETALKEAQQGGNLDVIASAEEAAEKADEAFTVAETVLSDAKQALSDLES